MKFPSPFWEKQADESQQIEQAYYTEVESPAGDGSKVGSSTIHPTNHSTLRTLHLPGTDDKGFDVFSRSMYGGRVSLTVGFAVIIPRPCWAFLADLPAILRNGWIGSSCVSWIFNCVPTMPMMMIVGVAPG